MQMRPVVGRSRPPAVELPMDPSTTIVSGILEILSTKPEELALQNEMQRLSLRGRSVDSFGGESCGFDGMDKRVIGPTNAIFPGPLEQWLPRYDTARVSDPGVIGDCRPKPAVPVHGVGRPLLQRPQYSHPVALPTLSSYPMSLTQQQSASRSCGRERAEQFPFVKKKNAPKPTQDRTVWRYCEICDCNVNSNYQFKIHTEGVKHRKKVDMLQKSSRTRSGPTYSRWSPWDPQTQWDRGQCPAVNCVIAPSPTLQEPDTSRYMYHFGKDQSENFAGSDTDSGIYDFNEERC